MRPYVVDSGGQVSASWKRGWVTAGAAVVLLALPVTSFAHHWAWKTDGDDAESAMDLKRVSVKVPKHKPGDGGQASCRLDFFGDPATEDINGRCEFDTKGGPKKDILILSYQNGDKYEAAASTWKGEYVTGGFPATWSRKNGDLILSIALKRLEGRSSHMNWKVSVEDGEDRAPDTGWFRFDWAN